MFTRTGPDRGLIQICSRPYAHKLHRNEAESCPRICSHRMATIRFIYKSARGAADHVQLVNFDDEYAGAHKSAYIALAARRRRVAGRTSQRDPKKARMSCGVLPTYCSRSGMATQPRPGAVPIWHACGLWEF